MYKPILFVIPNHLWTPYHNFGVFWWYNETQYKWVHRRITDPYNGPWKRYQYYANKSTGITQLTPDIVQSLELSKTFQKITRDENYSTPYFTQKIPDSDEENHIERDEPTFPRLLPLWMCCPDISGIYYYLFIIAEFLYVLISQVPKSPSRIIITDPFTRHFTTVNMYFYVLCQCYTYS